MLLLMQLKNNYHKLILRVNSKMYKAIKSIVSQDVRDKVVLIRADLNIPIQNGKIQDITRVSRSLPTIKFLLKEGSKIVICSHLGRPNGEYVENYSLKPLVSALSDILKIEVKFSTSCIGQDAIKAKKNLKSGEILLLENIRFHKGESENNAEFARDLSDFCDFFVNDAFSCSHRAHASLHAITNFLPSFSGILLDEEINALTSVLKLPVKPVAALVGGAKISTKINIIEFLITKMDFIIIGGAMANTFILAQGYNVGKSMVERDAIDMATKILEKSKKSNCKLIFPQDLIVSKYFEENSDHKIVDISNIPSEMMALDIGPKSIENIKSIFKNIKTLLWNGPLGAFEINPFGMGTFTLAKIAADLTVKDELITVAGGGDTASALNKAGVAGDFTYISSAGGAFLEWLEGIELPAISALGNN